MPCPSANFNIVWVDLFSALGPGNKEKRVTKHQPHMSPCVSCSSGCLYVFGRGGYLNCVAPPRELTIPLLLTHHRRPRSVERHRFAPSSHSSRLNCTLFRSCAVIILLRNTSDEQWRLNRRFALATCQVRFKRSGPNAVPPPLHACTFASSTCGSPAFSTHTKSRHRYGPELTD